MDLGIEGPVGDVKAFDLIGERPALERVRSEPAAAIPSADVLTDLGFAEFHRQHTLWTKRLLDLLVRHQRARTTKVTSLPDSRFIEYRNRLTALAADRGFLRLPSAPAVRDVPQGGDQIVFLDCFASRCGQLDLRGRGGTAEGADERLALWVPLRFATARGTGEFRLSREFSHDRRLEALRRGGAATSTQLFKNSSSANRGMRQVAPIFFPFSSPAVRLAITSDSLTPRILAASAGESSSGALWAVVAAGKGGGTAAAVPCASMPPGCCIICCAMPSPRAT